MIHFISTRGHAPQLNFEEVVLAGLASDGGLYVPETLPVMTPSEIAGLKGLSYPELAFAIIRRFTAGAMNDVELKAIIEKSYSTFRHAQIAPLVKLDAKHSILELFHGPTLAFKDFALQFLGNVLEHILQRRKQKIVIIGATSGDTGSAAIAGCQGRANMDIFILHPHGRTSDVQRKQMTTVADSNVHNIAIEGTFDDCQDIVKALFMDQAFREQTQLTAVNSINFARILGQIPYYFYAALQMDTPVSFCVPTGNFGDIYAGYLAKKMGLAIDRLIIASNRNDILDRCVKTGKYGMEGVTPSLSPSMDIQISSNFERLLFDLYDRDSAQIVGLMQSLRANKSFTLGAARHAALKAEFDSAHVDDETTLATIQATYERAGYLLDPHTAVGVKAAEICAPHTLVITLATAHPAKFPEAVKRATGVMPALPEHLADLMEREEKYQVMGNDVAAVKAFVLEAL